MYFRWTVFCALFAAVYENFSHNVYSDPMIYMFVYPLIGCILFIAILFIRPLNAPQPWARRLFGAGTAALAVGSCVRGIIEIYGTTSSLTSVYTVVGAVLVIAGTAVYIRDAITNIRRV